MGCSGCGRTAKAGKARYKYLTRSQIQIRFEKFKKDNCADLCDRIKECNIFEYRNCRIKKATFELI
ncbi:MAG TPA: hypothetical protein ENI23_04820 [bacterium]|nr:hypothetical protein [bacterium]